MQIHVFTASSTQGRGESSVSGLALPETVGKPDLVQFRKLKYSSDGSGLLNTTVFMARSLILSVGEELGICWLLASYRVASDGCLQIEVLLERRISLDRRCGSQWHSTYICTSTTVGEGEHPYKDQCSRRNTYTSRRLWRCL